MKKLLPSGNLGFCFDIDERTRELGDRRGKMFKVYINIHAADSEIVEELKCWCR